MKRQPSELEKTIANEATDKGLFSETYKQFKNQKNKQPNQKVGERHKQIVFQRIHTRGQ